MYTQNNRGIYMNDKILQAKTKSYASKIETLYKYLLIEKEEFFLSKNILKSGTATGAKTAQAFKANSLKSFCKKISSAKKAAEET